MDYLNADGLGIKHFGSQIKAFWGLPHSTKLSAGSAQGRLFRSGLKAQGQVLAIFEGWRWIGVDLAIFGITSHKF